MRGSLKRSVGWERQSGSLKTVGAWLPLTLAGEGWGGGVWRFSNICRSISANCHPRPDPPPRERKGGNEAAAVCALAVGAYENRDVWQGSLKTCADGLASQLRCAFQAAFGLPVPRKTAILRAFQAAAYCGGILRAARDIATRPRPSATLRRRKP